MIKTITEKLLVHPFYLINVRTTDHILLLLSGDRPG